MFYNKTKKNNLLYLQRDYFTQKASARSGQNSHILQGFFSHHKMVNISQNIDIKYIVKALISNRYVYDACRSLQCHRCKFSHSHIQFNFFVFVSQ